MNFVPGDPYTPQRRFILPGLEVFSGLLQLLEFPATRQTSLKVVQYIYIGVCSRRFTFFIEQFRKPFPDLVALHNHIPFSKFEIRDSG
jgi:hypothetical protein